MTVHQVAAFICVFPCLQGFFNVSADGWVTVAEPLRRERAAVVTLAVRVTDTSAVPPQHSTGQ